MLIFFADLLTFVEGVRLDFRGVWREDGGGFSLTFGGRVVDESAERRC